MEKENSDMVNTEEITCQLTSKDCEKILNYISWLEDNVESCGYDIGSEYIKVGDSIDKIIEGKK